MSGADWRDRRGLALIGALLIAASSARAAVSFERPDPIDSDHHEIVAAGSLDAAAPDAQRIVARAHAGDQQASVARRSAEIRHPIEMRVPAGRPATPGRALPERQDGRRLASRSGCAEVARWCLAHATSTQDP
jgi:hypothetical protein